MAAMGAAVVIHHWFQRGTADVPASVRRMRRGIAWIGYGIAVVFLAAFTTADLLIVRVVPPPYQATGRFLALAACVACAAVASVRGVQTLSAGYLAASEQRRRLAEIEGRMRAAERRVGQLTADLTERVRLEREWAQRARLDGALLVARTAAHEINNALAPVAGYAELLANRAQVAADPQMSSYVACIRQAAAETAARVHRLQRIVRLEEVESALGPRRPVLDLERSSAP